MVGGGALEMKDEEHTLIRAGILSGSPVGLLSAGCPAHSLCEHEGCHIYYAISSCRPPCGANCILFEKLQDL